MASRATTHRKEQRRRQKARKRAEQEALRSTWGVYDAERRAFEQLVAEVGLEQAREIRYAEQAARQPSDTGHRPSPGDPLLRGTARATGETAKAVQRRRTITRWQHEERTRP